MYEKGALDLVDRLNKELMTWEGVSSAKSRYSSNTSFKVGDKSFAHYHSNTEIDIRATKKVKRKYANELAANKLVRERRSQSDWVAVTFSSPQDLEFVLKFLKLAYEETLSASRRGRV